MAAAGLSPDDFGDGATEVWPENWTAHQLFCYMQTQWRAGSAGLIGLDYNVLDRKLTRMGLTPDEYDDLEADLQEMEYTALDAMHSHSN